MMKQQLIFLKECRMAHATFYRFLKCDKQKFMGLLVIIFGVAMTNTLMIWLLGLPFDYLAKENFDGLAQILLLLFFVIFLNQTLHYFSTYYSNVVALSFVGRLRVALLSHITNLPYILTDRLKKGDLLIRLSHDVDKVQNFIVAMPLFMASHIFTAIFYCAMLLYLDWKLAILALFLSSVYLIHQNVFVEKKRRAAQEFFRANGNLLSKEDEILTNSRIVGGFNAQKFVQEKHQSLFDIAFVWAKKERQLNALFTSSLAILIYLCALIIVYYGVHSVQNLTLSISGLVSFLLYMGYLSVPLRGISELIFEAQSDVMASKRIEEILNLEKLKKETLPTLKMTRGEIRIDDLSCTLGNTAVFNRFSIHVPAGKTVAVIGESGTGKSTLANLLLRFVDPEAGRVFIDEKNISNFDIKSLRDNVAIVWQTSLLFNDTIKNNLYLAKPDATQDELIIACKQSDAWDFITSLPDGLDTYLGPGRVELSAGQKQRIQISQALLRDPVILIMDEASSALDSHAEEKIVQTLIKSRRNKTTLLIAHRYSSVRHADLILYLNRDGSSDMGTHEELFKTHEAYRHALEWQVKR